MDKTSAPATTKKPSGSDTKGYRLQLKRLHTKAGVHPFDELTWVRRDAVIGSGDKKSFEQKGVEFPDHWSSNAVNITASKYFRGTLGTDERESSLKDMVTRITSEVRKWGMQGGYFVDEDEADIFEAELAYLLVNQHLSPNSPVWFNVGTKDVPQCSACFILEVEDNLPSILNWINTEGYIFNGGSGAGTSLSHIRSKQEKMSRGGRSSGPVSFMRGADSVAGMIASGGKTRRAAKMVVLDIGHPDIEDFIECKAEEENKIKALIDAGYNMSDLNNPAWNSIQYQNANNSVRITDEFMNAVKQDGEFSTRWVVSGEVAKTYRARDLFRKIAKAAWASADPGVQFHDVINDMHTAPNTAPIRASNPCSEYMHIDNSACNLASINLMKYLGEDGSFKVEEFTHAVRTSILMQEIIVGFSSYPTPKIAENTIAFRQLGLGYANIGALLMTKGYAYDSDEARAWCSAITSLMTGEAYRYSSKIARRMGPFSGYAVNEEPMLRVIGKHRDSAYQIDGSLVDDEDLAAAACTVWDQALESGKEHGYRNSQATVIAPTGTISFLMDCATSGIEPAFSLVSYKQLVGGGFMTLVNEAVPEALRRLGYDEVQIAQIGEHITTRGTIEGAPGLKAEHLPIFDCAVAPANGERSIDWRGHVRMLGAAQPFVSGAISKTCNMPSEATVEEIEEAYELAWDLKLKAFAVYRDGSKAAQPLSTGKKTSEKEPEAATVVPGAPLPESFRKKLPKTRVSETHKFAVAGHDGYVTAGLYPDGSLGEIFIKISRSGSTLAGLLDSFAISTSMALQYGVPLKALCAKFIYARFEPAGFTDNPDIRTATSILDYIFRYLALRHLGKDDLYDLGVAEPTTRQGAEPLIVASDALPETREEQAVAAAAAPVIEPAPAQPVTQAPKKGGMHIAETVCRKCGGMMVRTGSCQTCLQCGDTSGGCQ